MANAAISGENFADSGTISGQQTLDNPVANLLDPDVENRWRSPSNAATFVLDLGSLKNFNAVLLRGITGGVNSTQRLRVSTSDASGVAGDVLDTGVVAHGSQYYDTNYDAFAWVQAATIAGRYVRFDCSDPDAAFCDGGRLGVFNLTSFTYNFGYGWSIGWVDRSVVAESRGGQSLTWADNRYRLLEVALRWVTAAQRFGIVETIDRTNGRHTDICFCIDTASTNLARDTILGLATEVTAVVQPDPVFDAGGELYSKAYKIKERL